MSICLRVWLTVGALGLSVLAVHAENVTVNITTKSTFSPDNPTIYVGDTVHWNWVGSYHSTTSVTGSSESWNSGLRFSGNTFDHTFTHAGVFWYYCIPHGWDNGNGTAGGMAARITVLAIPTANLTSLALADPSVEGGATVTGTITLGANATAGGANITLASDNPAAATPSAANVTLAEGSITANFSVFTTPVDIATTANISTAYNGTTLTALLTVLPPHPLSAVTVSPGTVPGGSTAKGTVTLASTAMSNTTVALASDNATVVVPAQVTIPAQTLSANFTISTNTVTAEKMAMLTATAAGVTETAMVMVEPVAVSSLSLKPASVKGGAKATGTVTLQITAAANTIITLTSANTAVATVSAKTITASKGKKTATFVLTSKKVTAKKTVAIQAQAKGSSIVVSALLTVTK